MENIQTIELLSQNKKSVIGVPTGYTELDRLTSGLQNSDLIIVAGRPSMGKTALCLNIAQYVATMVGKWIAYCAGPEHAGASHAWHVGTRLARDLRSDRAALGVFHCQGQATCPVAAHS